LKLTLLGTGTSQGIPIIGCDCEVCHSEDLRDKRLRSAALISHENINILIDIGPDFRQQMLRESITHLNAILITHEHTDHVIGLDDVRPLNFASKKAMDVYCQERVANEIRKRFDYIFGEYVPGLPQVNLHHIERENKFTLHGIEIQCIGVEHGKLPILGFRVGEIAYLTDVKTLKPKEIKKLQGVKYLIVNALQINQHHSHMTLTEAIILAKKIGAEKTWLTHISHTMGLTDDMSEHLPDGIMFAFDGFQIEFEG
jgi:phosphoribosyl 1,2-cyclic phosphate phosphodiesterase